MFLLKTGGPQKRISVATSIGSYVLKKDDELVLKEALEHFSSISVREQHAKSQLQKLTTKDIKVILDPILLLNKKEWWNLLGCKSKFAEKKKNIF